MTMPVTTPSPKATPKIFSQKSNTTRYVGRPVARCSAPRIVSHAPSPMVKDGKMMWKEIVKANCSRESKSAVKCMTYLPRSGLFYELAIDANCSTSVTDCQKQLPFGPGCRVRERASARAPAAAFRHNEDRHMTPAEKVLYTAKVHTTGGRNGGTSRSSDGHLDIKHSTPGTGGSGTNPEQLFAAGWSAC